MALDIRGYTIIKVVQAAHHQGTCWGLQCSCLSVMSGTWILFRSPGIWDEFDLDCKLGEGDQFF